MARKRKKRIKKLKRKKSKKNKKRIKPKIIIRKDIELETFIFL